MTASRKSLVYLSDPECEAVVLRKKDYVCNQGYTLYDIELIHSNGGTYTQTAAEQELWSPRIAALDLSDIIAQVQFILSI